MLDDDFFGINDRREIDRLIPLNEMSEIAHKLFCMGFVDCQAKFPRRADREFAQFLFMFHVEQLRQSGDEVKTFSDGWHKSRHLLSRIRRLEGDLCQTLSWIFRALPGEVILPLV